MKPDDLLDAFREMTVLELSDFVKRFEETFHVTAAVPTAITPAPTQEAEQEVVEEQEEFDVVLEAVGSKKIQVIKEVRSITQLGLKDAKDLVDSVPKPLLEHVTKDVAEKAKRGLEAQGATVTVK